MDTNTLAQPLIEPLMKDIRDFCNQLDIPAMLTPLVR